MRTLKKLFNKAKKRLYAAGFWTCARCGTTNYDSQIFCKQCNNRRPY